MPVALFTVDFPDGGRIVERIEEPSAVDLAVAAPIIEAHLASAVAATGLHREVIAATWATMLVEQRHRERIYCEVAAERGVLAL